MNPYLKPWPPKLRRKVNFMVRSHLQPHRLRGFLSKEYLQPYPYPLFTLNSSENGSEDARGLGMGGSKGVPGE